MCCFSRPVKFVANTKIFARGVNGRQVLVYSMTYAAAADLAMVLPLPVPVNVPEDAVRFINLEDYPNFFEDMAKLSFIREREAERDDFVAGFAPAVPKLQVHDVGSFEASFVPRIEEFDRLDERFRLPGNVWDDLPTYRDYGFAVFKLKGTGSGGNGARRVHPMAFEFPRRDPDLLFFPTVHVHDGEVHPVAEFDHQLCFQSDEWTQELRRERWDECWRQPSEVMDISRTQGIVDPRQRCWMERIKGERENKDTWAGRASSIPKLRCSLERYPSRIVALEQGRQEGATWMIWFLDGGCRYCFTDQEQEVDGILANDPWNAVIYRVPTNMVKMGSGIYRVQWQRGER